MKTDGFAASGVLERFPDHRTIIVNLYAESEDFRELCDHFAECLDVLEKLSSAKQPEPRRIDEYRALVDELAEEIHTTTASSAWHSSQSKN